MGRPTNQGFYNFFVSKEHLSDELLLDEIMSLGFTFKEKAMVRDLIQTTHKARHDLSQG